MVSNVTRRLIHLGVALALCCPVVGCDRDRPKGTLPAALIVLPDAKAQRASDIYDGQIAYRVPDPYPGQRSIDEIRRRLLKLGWHRRERDLLNPASTFAVTARWRDAGDVIAWSEWWENGDGDAVMYGFKYLAPAGQDPSPNTPMEVLVSYFTSSSVQAIEEDVRLR